MRKAFFRSDYPLGYRMSDGSKGFEINPLPNAENYYALALSVYENMPSGKALYKMGIAPEVKTVIYEDAPSRQLSKIAYVLTALCGMQQKVVAPLLSVSKQTLRRAINYQREGLAT